MAPFGKFTVHVPTTLSFGNLTLELPAGEYEPKDAEELDALLHLASMSFQPEGADKSTAYAEQSQAPDAPPVIPPESAPVPEAPLPEPPAPAPAPEPAPEAPAAEPQA
jgi:hypothetical protein